MSPAERVRDDPLRDSPLNLAAQEQQTVCLELIVRFKRRRLVRRDGCIRQMVGTQAFTAVAIRPSPRSGRSLRFQRASGEKRPIRPDEGKPMSDAAESLPHPRPDPPTAAFLLYANSIVGEGGERGGSMSCHQSANAPDRGCAISISSLAVCDFEKSVKEVPWIVTLRSETVRIQTHPLRGGSLCQKALSFPPPLDPRASQPASSSSR
jgi:hypothetical protein